MTNLIRSSLALASFAATALFLTGCSQGPAPAPVAPAKVAKVFTPEQHAQAIAFVQAYAKAIRESDAATANKSLDLDALLEHVTYGLTLEKRADAQFRKGFKEGLTNANGGIAASFLGAFYEMVPYTGTPENPQYICRKVLEDGGIDYHKFEISFDTGAPKITDMYIFTTGEYLSENFRRMILPMAASMDKSLIKRLANKSSTDKYLAGIKMLPAVTQHVLAMEYQQAYNQIQRLPPEIKAEKPVRIITLSVLSSLEDKEQEYITELESYRAAFPNDPSLGLVLVDYYFLKQDYEQAMKTVTDLQESVGGDPYLDLFLATCQYEMGQGAAGLEFARKFYDAFPDRLDGIFAVFQGHTMEKNFAEAHKALEVIRDDLELEFDLDELIPEAPWVKPFAESDEGKKYMKGIN